MANMSLSFNATYDDGVLQPIVAAVVARLKTITTTRPFANVQSVGTSEEVIGLGDVGTPCTLVLQNLDPTNYIDVKVATGGAIFARLRPDTDQDGKGGFCVLDEAGSGAAVPFAIANTLACRMYVFAAPA